MRVALEFALFVVCCYLLVNARCSVFVVCCLLDVARWLFDACRFRKCVVCCLLFFVG